MISTAESAEESLYYKWYMSMLQPRRRGKWDIENKIRLLAKFTKHEKDKAQTL